jgi:hypothetical protein
MTHDQPGTMAIEDFADELLFARFEGQSLIRCRGCLLKAKTGQTGILARSEYHPTSRSGRYSYL